MHRKSKLGEIMMLNNKNQKAGDNSQQLQADRMVFNIGIDEKRAREIYQEMNLQLRSDYSQEALSIANTRLAEFENKLLPKMEAVNGALEAFADPSFQLLLVEAQKTAASTERPADYDLLAELLLHRFQKGENRFIRAGISRAVEIVDEISDDALLGLTVFHAVSSFFPSTNNINKGLDILDELFGKIIYDVLPNGNEWLDHLDILDAVRISSFGGLKKIEQYYPERLATYIEIGIEKESENHHKAIELLTINHMPKDLLAEHTLNSNYLRINLFKKEEIDALILEQHIVQNGQRYAISVKLTAEQKNALYSIYNLYKKNEPTKQQNIKKLMEEWDKRTNLKILQKWWDSININVQLTSVGKVLAHSNAQRCDKNLPPLD